MKISIKLMFVVLGMVLSLFAVQDLSAEPPQVISGVICEIERGRPCKIKVCETLNCNNCDWIRRMRVGWLEMNHEIYLDTEKDITVFAKPWRGQVYSACTLLEYDDEVLCIPLAQCTCECEGGSGPCDDYCCE